MSPHFPLRAFSKIRILFEFRTHPTSVIRVGTKVVFTFTPSVDYVTKCTVPHIRSEENRGSPVLLTSKQWF
jgi:hypothetical protein